MVCDDQSPRRLYGRLAIIYCDGMPAIELLEIVAFNGAA